MKFIRALMKKVNEGLFIIETVAPPIVLTGKKFVPEPYLKDQSMICPFCKYEFLIEVGRLRQWRLDCSHCLELGSQISVSATVFSFQEEVWVPVTHHLYFTVPGDDNTFAWKFDYSNKTTQLVRIEKDCDKPEVFKSDTLMNINPDNFYKKVSLCLMFS